MMDNLDSWGPLEEKPKLERIHIGGVALKAGDQVRLRPLHGADIFDMVLAGKIATIESIIQDYEDKVYIAVTVDDDPGKDFGEQLQPGHRFFFSAFEVEPLSEAERESL